MLPEQFHNIERERILLNPFYKFSITLIPHPEVDKGKKKRKRKSYVNFFDENRFNKTQ
jgi:hypothetical protein